MYTSAVILRHFRPRLLADSSTVCINIVHSVAFKMQQQQQAQLKPNGYSSGIAVAQPNQPMMQTYVGTNMMHPPPSPYPPGKGCTLPMGAIPIKQQQFQQAAVSSKCMSSGGSAAQAPTQLFAPPALQQVPLQLSRDYHPPRVRRLRAVAGDPDTGNLAAVIVTISDGRSYDDLFQKVPQQGPEGTYVATYCIDSLSLRHILASLRDVHGNSSDAPTDAMGEEFRNLLRDLRVVEANSVVFNWECCSGISNENFSDAEVVMDLMQCLIARGHMVMCSDFSLKALIKCWSERRLGPNPFVKIGEFGGQMQLQFQPETLAACPSAQLQKAGEMCENGTATVHALSSTIAYTVDKRKVGSTQAYSCEVLTVANDMPGIDSTSLPSHLRCDVANGDYTGAAGHVVLKYPSGGIILTSAGHWVELVKIGVSEERLLSVAAASYGQAYAEGMQQQFASCRTTAERAATLQTVSQRMVQQSAPCSYSMSSM